MSISLEMLDNFANSVIDKCLQNWEQEQRDIEEFRAIDLPRLLFDKEYKRRCDEHFGEGWLERVRWKR